MKLPELGPSFFSLLRLNIIYAYINASIQIFVFIYIHMCYLERTLSLVLVFKIILLYGLQLQFLKGYMHTPLVGESFQKCFKFCPIKPKIMRSSLRSQQGLCHFSHVGKWGLVPGQFTTYDVLRPEFIAPVTTDGQRTALASRGHQTQCKALGCSCTSLWK